MVKEKNANFWDNLLKPTYSFIKSFYFMTIHVFLRKYLWSLLGSILNNGNEVCLYNKIIIKYFIENLTVRMYLKNQAWEPCSKGPNTHWCKTWYITMHSPTKTLTQDMKELLQENDWFMKMKLALLFNGVERGNQKTLLFISLRCAG